MKLKDSKKGMMGIGTLVIFIAVILVAAVAAAVLISTSGSLQQRGLQTGQQAEAGVSTGAEVVTVTGTDGSSGGDIENFEVIVRLQSGSEAMSFNTTVLIMDTSTTSQSLTYNGTLSTDSGYGVTTADYRVYYLKQGPDYQAGYLSRGDLVKLKLKCNDCTTGDTGGVGENKRVRMKIIPRVGATTQIVFTTPDVITQNRVSLWP